MLHFVGDIAQIRIDPTQPQSLVAGINDWWYNDNAPVIGTLGTWSLPGSLHPGGCQFAMGDGGVHWVSEQVPQVTLGHLSTIGESVLVTFD